jgi:ABC-2 type transport system permease protein
VKVRVLESLTYRFEVLTGVATRLVVLATAVYLWRAAFSGVGEASGTTEDEMVRYAIMSAAVGPVLASRVAGKVHERVRTGDISLDLLRPIAMPAKWLAEDIGESVVAGLLLSLPLVVFGTLLFGPALPAGPAAALLFPISVALGYGVSWLISALCALIPLWALEIGNLGHAKDAVLRILSGSLVPLWFFPEWAQDVSKFLPFQYTYQAPLAIFIGKDLRAGQVAQGFLAQAVWILILGAIFAWGWSRGRRRLMTQGG